MHKRQQIRQKVSSKLKISLPPEMTIHTSKVMTIQEESLPVCMVYFDRGSVDQRTIDSVGIETSGTLNIELMDRDSVNIDNQLDGWAEIIEAALIPDYTLGGLVEDLNLVSFEYVRDDQQPLASLILSFTANFEG